MQWINIPLALIAVWLTWELSADDRRRKDRNNERYNVLIAAGIYISGLILYLIGFNYEGSQHNVVALVGRSMLSALEMFVSHSDLIEVSPECKENFVYMAVFSLVHFLAVFVNISLLFNIIGFQSSAFRKVRGWLKSNVKRNLYVFVGEGDATMLLTADIRKNDPQAWIVWVRNFEKAEDSHLSLSGVLSRVSYRRELVEEADEVGAVLLRSRMAVLNAAKTYDLKSVMKDLGLSNLERLLQNTETANLFFISDDIEKNMARTQMFSGIRTSKQIHIFCHACRNELNIALENPQAKPDENGYPPKVTLVDSAYMSMMKLMETPMQSPLSVAGYAADGSVSEPFTSLVVGFGNYGREAVRFLHEYACFTAPDGSRTKHECTVVDSKMDSIAGPFFIQSPALRTNPDYRFCQCNAGSVEFWDIVAGMADRLNYAVVAMDDDMLNLRTAVEIYNQVSKARGNDMRDFMILTRCYNPSNGQYVTSVIDFYNTLNASSGGRIVAFGRKKDIFSYDVLFNSMVSKGLEPFYRTCLQRVGRVAQVFDLGQVKDMQQLSEVRRFLSQLVSHCLHIPSTLYVAGVRGADGWFSQQDVALINRFVDMLESKKSSGSGISYESADQVTNRLMYNMARTEYHRWKAFLDCGGYTPVPGMTEEKYRQYFYAAIETAFLVAQMAIKESNKTPME